MSRRKKDGAPNRLKDLRYKKVKEIENDLNQEITDIRVALINTGSPQEFRGIKEDMELTKQLLIKEWKACNDDEAAYKKSLLGKSPQELDVTQKCMLIENTLKNIDQIQGEELYKRLDSEQPENTSTTSTTTTTSATTTFEVTKDQKSTESPKIMQYPNERYDHDVPLTSEEIDEIITLPRGTTLAFNNHNWLSTPKSTTDLTPWGSTHNSTSIGNDSQNDNTGSIIGGTVGGIALVAVAFVVYYCRKAIGKHATRPFMNMWSSDNEKPEDDIELSAHECKIKQSQIGDLINIGGPSHHLDDLHEREVLLNNGRDLIGKATYTVEHEV